MHVYHVIKCISVGLFMCAHFSIHRQNHYHGYLLLFARGHSVLDFFQLNSLLSPLHLILYYFLRVYFNFSFSFSAVSWKPFCISLVRLIFLIIYSIRFGNRSTRCSLLLLLLLHNHRITFQILQMW